MPMKIAFCKYQGTGNDFILIDGREGLSSLPAEKVAALCHRRFGIGADGLILLINEPGYDFRMVYYNSDGNESTMCGNGGRCIAAFARMLGIPGDAYHFLGVDGPHVATFLPDGNVKLQMKDVAAVETVDGFLFVDTGSPHAVLKVTGLDDMDVCAEGKAIRYSERYQTNGVNVNFVQPSTNGLSVRTYERGVENETYSCGTGVTAAVLSAAVSGWIPSANGVCRVQTPGGSLLVYFSQQGDGFIDIWLEGPAEHVFDGIFESDDFS
jgi:diaminopimelate epimerase